MSAAIGDMPVRHGLNRGLSIGQSSFVVCALVIAIIALSPVLTLGIIAFGGDASVWSHLFATIIPDAAGQTAGLLLGVGLFVMVVGIATAWLVSMYSFPGQRLLDVALMLPLAIPTYVIAYSYLDLMHPIGPVQSGLRAMLGYARPQDLRLPDIRSLGGAIFLFGIVLYPYVYVSVRAVFLLQVSSLVEAARTLGMGGAGVFFRVALPLARPAVAGGTALALMEALNDVGASEFLGVNTLTMAIYSTWINRSNLAGAAQIALVMLVVVVALILVERWARRGRSFAVLGRNTRPVQPRLVTGWRGWGLFVLGMLPVLCGFVLPVAHLGHEALKRLAFTGWPADLARETVNTVLVSAAATVLIIIAGLAAAFSTRLARRSLAAGVLARVPGLGYAIPGVVLSLGLMTALGWSDRLIGAVMDGVFGVSTGLILSGSVWALMLAYFIRFLAISVGNIETGLGRVSMSLDHAARIMGRSALGVLAAVHLPLLRPAITGAALLVFVDCMKELPATLMLRPLNFETLATHLYAEAVRGTYEDGSLAALLIIGFGLLPVLVLARIGRRAAVGAAAQGEAS